MNNEKKIYLENSGAVNYIKKAMESLNREFDEYFIYLIADYMDSLSKLSLSFPVDIDYTIASFLNAVGEINLVDPLIYNTNLDGKKLSIAYSQKTENVHIDFFSQVTNVLSKKGVFKIGNIDEKDNALQGASSEYITQIVYGVSKNPDMAMQINADNNNQKSSSYSNVFSSNPALSNLLNVIALTTDLSINYILSLSFTDDGDKDLKELFDKVHGVGAYEELMEQISNLEIKKEPVDIEKISDVNNSDLMNSGKNICIGNISEHDLDVVRKSEFKMVNDFFEKFDDDYKQENYEKLQESISSDEVKNHFEEQFSKVRTNAKMRVLRKENHGFIALKYVFGIIIIIILIVIIAAKVSGFSF